MARKNRMCACMHATGNTLFVCTKSMFLHSASPVTSLEDMVCLCPLGKLSGERAGGAGGRGWGVTMSLSRHHPLAHPSLLFFQALSQPHPLPPSQARDDSLMDRSPASQHPVAIVTAFPCRSSHRGDRVGREGGEGREGTGHGERGKP